MGKLGIFAYHFKPKRRCAKFRRTSEWWVHAYKYVYH